MTLILSLAAVGVTTSPSLATRTTYTVGSCQQHVFFRSTANGKYVSVETGYTGGSYAMLRARSSVVGTKERFTRCIATSSNGSRYTVLKSEANGKWVSVEYAYAGANHGMVRARSSSIGGWELYFCGFDTFVHGSPLMLVSEANTSIPMLSAETGFKGGEYGMLRARTSFGSHMPGRNELYTTDMGHSFCD